MPLTAKRTGRLRWWIIGLVMLGATINYLSRSTMGVVAPTLVTGQQITTEQYSYITGAFQLGLMLQPICGYVLDTLGLRRGFGLFAVAWSLITMAHSLASTWPIFAGLRFMLGLAEGSANPAGMKAVSEWFPAKERGLAAGVFNIGASAGSILAPPLVAWAILSYNWQAAFVIVGILGLMWVGLWFWVYRAPEQHPRLGSGERALIEEGRQTANAGGVRPSVWRILRQRNFWGIALPRFLADPTWGTLSFWAPLYFSTVRGFDLTQIALFTWLPFVAADVGCLFGPTVALFLQQRGIGLVNARRGAFTLGAVLMIGVAFVGFVDNAYVAILLLCLGGFAHQMLSVTVITMSSDLFPRNEVATVTGLAGMMGNFGVLVFSLMIGGLVASVGYTPFFVALAALDVVGAIVLWTLVRVPAVAPTPGGAAPVGTAP
jgi:MFS transporter, ACS family, hexuronate transporter